MNSNNQFQVICVGGGLAGLSMAILLAKAGIKVAVIEKKSYPMHKVCGEYLSLESWNFLENLGLPLQEWNLPIINQLQISAIPNYSTNSHLPLGGFGISRYLLDEQLANLAKLHGVYLLENTTVKSFAGDVNNFSVQTSNGEYYCNLLIGSFGKLSVGNFNNQKLTIENYVGIKYHIKYNFPNNKIALHNFKNGYAGISAIEDNKYCFCYMVNAQSLKQFSSIDEMNALHLSKNIFLKDIFNNADFLWDKPLTISNIYFGQKKIVNQQILYTGDSAGAIPPLAGNGMSMAFRTAFLLSPLIIKYLENKISFTELQNQYVAIWQSNFASRIRNGKVLQTVFAKTFTSKVALQLFNWLKPIQPFIIKQTHGNPF